jgi:nucleotide-binding universal stress UspA family protein
MPRLILVPLDGSAFSAAALPAAAAIARRHRAAVHLVSVFTPLLAPLPFAGAPERDERLDEEQRAALGRALRRHADRLRDEAGISVTWATVDGDPDDALIAEAKATGADLIVLTSHGAGGFERAWLGSVADALVRRAPAPVLIIRPDGAPSSDTASGGALRSGDGDAYRFARVLVPLDGSALAEEALAAAVELSGGERTTFLLLRVVPVPHTIALEEETFWMPREEAAIEAARATAASYLEGVASGLRAAGHQVEIVAVLDHDPARAVLREAAERGAELIAVSTHGRTGFARLRLGRVADKVVRASPCPTLVARPAAAADGAPASR